MRTHTPGLSGAVRAWGLVGTCTPESRLRNDGVPTPPPPSPPLLPIPPREEEREELTPTEEPVEEVEDEEEEEEELREFKEEREEVRVIVALRTVRDSGEEIGSTTAE